MAYSATRPEPSALWSFVIEGGLLPWAPDSGSSTSPKPSDLARTVHRGLLALGGAGAFFLVGAAIVAWRGRGEPGSPGTA